MLINREGYTFNTNVKIKNHQSDKTLADIYSQMAIDYILKYHSDLIGETMTQAVDIILAPGFKNSIGRRKNKIVMILGNRGPL